MTASRRLPALLPECQHPRLLVTGAWCPLCEGDEDDRARAVLAWVRLSPGASSVGVAHALSLDRQEVVRILARLDTEGLVRTELRWVAA